MEKAWLVSPLSKKATIFFSSISTFESRLCLARVAVHSRVRMRTKGVICLICQQDLQQGRSQQKGHKMLSSRRVIPRMACFLRVYPLRFHSVQVCLLEDWITDTSSSIRPTISLLKSFSPYSRRAFGLCGDLASVQLLRVCWEWQSSMQLRLLSLNDLGWMVYLGILIVCCTAFQYVLGAMVSAVRAGSLMDLTILCSFVFYRLQRGYRRWAITRSRSRVAALKYSRSVFSIPVFSLVILHDSVRVFPVFSACFKRVFALWSYSLSLLFQRPFWYNNSFIEGSLGTSVEQSKDQRVIPVSAQLNLLNFSVFCLSKRKGICRPVLGAEPCFLYLQQQRLNSQNMRLDLVRISIRCIFLSISSVFILISMLLCSSLLLLMVRLVITRFRSSISCKNIRLILVAGVKGLSSLPFSLSYRFWMQPSFIWMERLNSMIFSSQLCSILIYSCSFSSSICCCSNRDEASPSFSFRIRMQFYQSCLFWVDRSTAIYLSRDTLSLMMDSLTCLSSRLLRCSSERASSSLSFSLCRNLSLERQLMQEPPVSSST